MKYIGQKLSLEGSLPTSVHSWLGQQLETRGIDAVIYTRYILSLLQNDSYENDSAADYYPSSRHSIYTVSPSRGQPARGKRKRSDEELRKLAAVECLLAVSDEDWGIESLVDELYSKLKEQESKRVSLSVPLRSQDYSDSSGTESDDPAERYYAAFPALSKETEALVTAPLRPLKEGEAWADIAQKALSSNNSSNSKVPTTDNYNTMVTGQGGCDSSGSPNDVRNDPREVSQELMSQWRSEMTTPVMSGGGGGGSGGGGCACQPAFVPVSSHWCISCSMHDTCHKWSSRIQAFSHKFEGRRKMDIISARKRAASPTSDWVDSRFEEEEKEEEKPKGFKWWKDDTWQRLCGKEWLERLMEMLRIQEAEHGNAEDQSWYTQPLEALMPTSPIPSQRLYHRHSATSDDENVFSHFLTDSLELAQLIHGPGEEIAKYLAQLKERLDMELESYAEEDVASVPSSINGELLTDGAVVEETSHCTCDGDIHADKEEDDIDFFIRDLWSVSNISSLETVDVDVGRAVEEQCDAVASALVSPCSGEDTSGEEETLCAGAAMAWLKPDEVETEKCCDITEHSDRAVAPPLGGESPASLLLPLFNCDIWKSNSAVAVLMPGIWAAGLEFCSSRSTATPHSVFWPSDHLNDVDYDDEQSFCSYHCSRISKLITPDKEPGFGSEIWDCLMSPPDGGLPSFRTLFSPMQEGGWPTFSQLLSPKFDGGMTSPLWDINMSRRYDLETPHSDILTPINTIRRYLLNLQVGGPAREVFIQGGLYGSKLGAEENAIWGPGTEAGEGMAAILDEEEDWEIPEPGLLTQRSCSANNLGELMSHVSARLPSENTAFTASIPSRIPMLPHVESEPSLALLDGTRAPCGRSGRLVQVRYLYKSDTSILPQLGLATAQSPSPHQSMQVSPHTHFCPIRSPKDATIPPPQVHEEEQNPEDEEQEVDLMNYKPDSNYQLYVGEETGGKPRFIPRFKIEKCRDHSAQTGTNDHEEEGRPDPDGEVEICAMVEVNLNDNEETDAVAAKLEQNPETSTCVKQPFEMIFSSEIQDELELSHEDAEKLAVEDMLNYEFFAHAVAASPNIDYSSDYESMAPDLSLEDLSGLHLAELWGNESETERCACGNHECGPASETTQDGERHCKGGCATTWKPPAQLGSAAETPVSSAAETASFGSLAQKSEEAFAAFGTYGTFVGGQPSVVTTCANSGFKSIWSCASEDEPALDMCSTTLVAGLNQLHEGGMLNMNKEEVWTRPDLGGAITAVNDQKLEDGCASMLWDHTGENAPVPSSAPWDEDKPPDPPPSETTWSDKQKCLGTNASWNQLPNDDPLPKSATWQQNENITPCSMRSWRKAEEIDLQDSSGPWMDKSEENLRNASWGQKMMKEVAPPSAPWIEAEPPKIMMKWSEGDLPVGKSPPRWTNLMEDIINNIDVSLSSVWSAEEEPPQSPDVTLGLSYLQHNSVSHNEASDNTAVGPSMKKWSLSEVPDTSSIVPSLVWKTNGESDVDPAQHSVSTWSQAKEELPAASDCPDTGSALDVERQTSRTPAGKIADSSEKVPVQKESLQSQSSVDSKGATEFIYSSQLEEQWLSDVSAFEVQVPRKNKSKQGQRKPCSFFMEGHCRRTDCKFAHDVSQITCRFWEEGDCFKGPTCPFLHGYSSYMSSNKPKPVSKTSSRENVSRDSGPGTPNTSGKFELNDDEFPELGKSLPKSGGSLVTKGGDSTEDTLLNTRRKSSPLDVSKHSKKSRDGSEYKGRKSQRKSLDEGKPRIIYAGGNRHGQGGSKVTTGFKVAGSPVSRVKEGEHFRRSPQRSSPMSGKTASRKGTPTRRSESPRSSM